MHALHYKYYYGNWPNASHCTLLVYWPLPWQSRNTAVFPRNPSQWFRADAGRHDTAYDYVSMQHLNKTLPQILRYLAKHSVLLFDDEVFYDPYPKAMRKTVKDKSALSESGIFVHFTTCSTIKPHTSGYRFYHNNISLQDLTITKFVSAVSSYGVWLSLRLIKMCLLKCERASRP